jgi:hypothetical protein
MVFYIKVEVSETSYTGQGSINSPTIWCFISSVLSQCHNQRASGMLFTSPAGDTVVRFNMVGFVDDSTCITGGNPNDTLQELLKKMKDVTFHKRWVKQILII